MLLEFLGEVRARLCMRGFVFMVEVVTYCLKRNGPIFGRFCVMLGNHNRQYTGRHHRVTTANNLGVKFVVSAGVFPMFFANCSTAAKPPISFRFKQLTTYHVVG